MLLDLSTLTKITTSACPTATITVQEEVTVTVTTTVYSWVAEPEETTSV